MKNKTNEKVFKKLENLYKQNNISKKIERLILIFKTILTLAIIAICTIAIGWFIGTIITLKMECGG